MTANSPTATADTATAAESREPAAAVGQSQAAVGRVVGTEDATPLQFGVAVGAGDYLQLDEVVVTTREVPGTGPVALAGVVTQVRARHEGASFGSDVFLIADGVLPANVQEIAEVGVTRVDPEVYVPPLPGAAVSRATAAERDRALYFDQMDRKVPVGMGRDGEPVFVNLDFLTGVRGAHVNISGISGVATKTSFALFLLHALFSTGELGVNAKALIFSVKGEDLLFLDRPNARLDDDARAAYGRLGLPPEPFGSVAMFAPPLAGDRNARPNVTGRTEGVAAFWWTLTEFCAQGLLRFVFADAEDERQQYTMVIHQVAAQLKAATKIDDAGAIAIDGQTLRTYADLVGCVTDKLSDDNTRQQWAGPVTGLGTVNAFLRRLQSSQRALSAIVRSDVPGAHGIDTQHQVTVVDLHNLPERAQRFVVGVVLERETRRKEDAGPGALLFTMIDELNKYAPREGTSPIAETLLDIAERGRSLGIILIGAQQTASEVERRIVANCSVRVVGRLDPAEAARAEYGFLPASQRQRAVLAKPGTMFISQPEIPVPLAITFPFPAWATRADEVAPTAGLAPSSGDGSRSDPFAGIPAHDDDIPF